MGAYDHGRRRWCVRATGQPKAAHLKLKGVVEPCRVVENGDICDAHARHKLCSRQDGRACTTPGKHAHATRSALSGPVPRWRRPHG